MIKIEKIMKWALSELRKTKLKIKFKNNLIIEKRKSCKPCYIGKNVVIDIKDGASVIIRPGAYISEGCYIQAYGGNIFIGDYTYLGPGCKLCARDGIQIGHNSLLGPNVSLYDHNHIFDNIGRIIQEQYSAKSIKVGDNCWLATNVVVTKGSSISNSVTVGANSVVNSNLYCEKSIYVGLPARMVKKDG